MSRQTRRQFMGRSVAAGIGIGAGFAIGGTKSSGRVVYITCSVLRAENEDRIAGFMAAHEDFLPIDAGAQARSAGLPALAEHRSAFGPGFRLSPRATGTDGFYIASLARL